MNVLRYLTVFDSVDKGNTYITEWGLTNKGSDIRSLKDISNFIPKTSLGFVYHHDEALKVDTRFLIYQLAEGGVNMFNMKSKQSASPSSICR